jgi:hypothetical protein
MGRIGLQRFFSLKGISPEENVWVHGLAWPGLNSCLSDSKSFDPLGR